jgi:hypothetical protein
VFAKRCAAKAAARRKKRDRFEQIGFARAVRPGEHDRPAAQFHIRARIGTEIRQREPRYMQRTAERLLEFSGMTDGLIQRKGRS